jgi:hypothetical protein
VRDGGQPCPEHQGCDCDAHTAQDIAMRSSNAAPWRARSPSVARQVARASTYEAAGSRFYIADTLSSEGYGQAAWREAAEETRITSW